MLKEWDEGRRDSRYQAIESLVVEDLVEELGWMGLDVLKTLDGGESNELFDRVGRVLLTLIPRQAER